MGRLVGVVKASLAVMLLALAGGALAIDLNEAKTTGLVGETIEGYLAVVEASAPPEAVALVAQVNARRRAEYQRIADQNDIPLADVEALAAKKAIEKTRPGGWVRLNGNWRQK